jgi:hypothetical protein
MGLHCRRLQEPCRSDGKVLMTNLFRNVEGSPSDPVDTWPYEGMVSVIEYGMLGDWRPIVRHLQGDPWGRVARNIEQYLQHASDSQVASYFRLVLERVRADAEAAEREEIAARVRECIARSGVSAQEFARSIGTSASRLSTYARGTVTPSAALLLRMETHAARGKESRAPQMTQS